MRGFAPGAGDYDARGLKLKNQSQVGHVTSTDGMGCQCLFWWPWMLWYTVVYCDAQALHPPELRDKAVSRNVLFQRKEEYVGRMPRSTLINIMLPKVQHPMDSTGCRQVKWGLLPWGGQMGSTAKFPRSSVVWLCMIMYCQYVWNIGIPDTIPSDHRGQTVWATSHMTCDKSGRTYECKEGGSTPQKTGLWVEMSCSY